MKLEIAFSVASAEVQMNAVSIQRKIHILQDFHR